jgi:hypothetical protein
MAKALFSELTANVVQSEGLWPSMGVREMLEAGMGHERRLRTRTHASSRTLHQSQFPLAQGIPRPNCMALRSAMIQAKMARARGGTGVEARG